MLHDGKFRVKLGLPDGDAFPTSPAPERGDVFYRADEDKIYRYNGATWVVIYQGITAADVINVPAGDIVAADVQAAIDELDTEKRAISDGLVFVRADKDADGDYDPLTSTSWDGDGYSTGNGTIDWNAVFGVPTTAKAVVLRVSVRDSGGAGYSISFKAKSTTTEYGFACRTTAAAANKFHDSHGVVPVAADETSYYSIVASGAGTLDVWIWVVGWYV